MGTGIRATVEFSTPDLCPVVALSARSGTTIDSVSASVCVPGSTGAVTEFETDADPETETEPGPDGGRECSDLQRVFSHGSATRYRFSHEEPLGCPCECLGQFGCAVTRYVAREGTLTLVFHAADYDRLREVVGELGDRFPDLDVKRFIRSPDASRSRDEVLVDRGKLTARQLEVLETAHEMGYFDRPREANATEVAAALDISPSTFREHLVAAQTKLFADIL